MMGWALVVVALLLAGFALLLLEVFVLPGFGVVGGLGIASLIGAAVTAWLTLGRVEGTLAFAAGVAGTAVLVWWLPRSRAGKAMVLEEGLKERAPDPQLAELVGLYGKAVTPLRPSGAVKLGDRVVDVVTEGVYVEPGTRVRVSQVEGARVVVEPVPDYQGE